MTLIYPSLTFCSLCKAKANFLEEINFAPSHILSTIATVELIRTTIKEESITPLKSETYLQEKLSIPAKIKDPNTQSIHEIPVIPKPGTTKTSSNIRIIPIAKIIISQFDAKPSI